MTSLILGLVIVILVFVTVYLYDIDLTKLKQEILTFNRILTVVQGLTGGFEGKKGVINKNKIKNIFVFLEQRFPHFACAFSYL